MKELNVDRGKMPMEDILCVFRFAGQPVDKPQFLIGQMVFNGGKFKIKAYKAFYPTDSFEAYQPILNDKGGHYHVL
jgi:hypothetical protein